ncbi:hypothetical protein [Micromonospora deserti]|uniref:Uncharacterized protein n=1 Tax=Micromonospora deserti TaxID=2070366 RepID=A0A2W2CFT8_9ACTN|nr:hypothetical protein [Micromonospora deserti]PZF98255.1 hypothetical protein C1I99_13800 [Micromonospora deserti]
MTLLHFLGPGGELVPVSAADPMPATDAGAVQAADVNATAPVTWDAGTSTIGILTDQANGVPLLDANGLVKLAQMPIAGLNYHGNWDASTNTPTLANGTGTAGDFYRVSVAGTQDLGAGPIVFEVGDHVIYEGAVWQQFDPPQTVAWGDLTGTLADQTDLQTALDAKLTTPTPLITKVVIGTTLSTTVIGMVGYDQDVLGDTLVMRRLSGAVAAADAVQTDETVTLAQLNAAIAGIGTQSDLGAPQSHNTTDVFLTQSSPTVQLIDNSAGDTLVNLPAAADTTPGKRFIIKRTSAGAHGFDIQSGDTNGGLIDGVESIGIAAQYSFREVVFDGTNWQIIGTGGS